MTKIALAYKNFAINRGISHIGLGVSALNTSKMLRRAAIEALVWPIRNSAELEARLAATTGVTHVVVSAPWIPTIEMLGLLERHSDVQFAVNCHSNVGFLQADVAGVRLVREAMEIERGSLNFHLAGNSEKFARWVRSAYNVGCVCLPNLYYLDRATPRVRPPFCATGGTLRIGAFGAMRPLKNFMSAAGAAVEIACTMKADTELWVSGGRAEGGGETVRGAMQQMLRGLPYIKLVENTWQSWPQFRSTVGHMNLLLQPSYTESFNMVTADGIAEGVPSVVSEAIDWVPQYWQACIDDVSDIARTGRQLLHDSRAAEDGWEALNAHNEHGMKAWRDFLGL